MKILLITDSHTPHGGGAEKYFFTLKEKLAQRQDVQVFSLGFAPQKAAGDDFITLSETSSIFLRLFWRIFFNPFKYWQLRKAIKKINPDVIHLHNIKKYTISLLQAVKGYPIVQTVHDFGLICPIAWNIHQNLSPCPSGLRWQCLLAHRQSHYPLPVYLALLFSLWKTKRLVKQRVQHYLTPSPFLAAYLEKNDFCPVTALFPFKNEPALPTPMTTSTHFLYLGQLKKHKGVPILLEEFALACKQNPNLSLTLAGRTDNKAALQKQIDVLGITQHIHLSDWQNDPSELYNQATAVIFPSIWLEAFGLVITEAMSHARPVIGSNRGPTTLLVDHEKTGLLFDPLKKGDLAQAILKMANNMELAKQYGINAYQKFKAFPSDQQLLDEVMKIYKDVQHKKGA